MSVGGAGLPVRRGTVHRGGRRPRDWRPDISRGIVVVLVAAVAAGSLGFVAGAIGPDPSPKPTKPGLANASESPGSSDAPSGNVLPSLPSEASPSGSPGPSQSTGPQRGSVPIVPVLGFWSTRSSISSADLRAALTGKSTKFRNVVIGADDREAIATAVGVKIADSVADGTAEDIRTAVRSGSLGLLRAADVTPAVHALGIDDKQLFGVERVTQIADWPLVVTADETADRLWDATKVWTIAAAGDILLDRGPARQMTILKKGVDFPFDGGSADITGFRCCSGLGHPVPTFRRTGNAGAVRKLIQGADLAMANLETPVDDQFRFHSSGTIFQGNPKLLKGLKNVGLDYASLANNHIGNAGPDGIIETVDGLDKLGIRHAGAGKDLAAAVTPATYEISGVRIAVLGCDVITAVYWAKAGKPGSNPCQAKTMIPAIRKAKASHDLVIIYPHWGIEYHATPSPLQRDYAKKWVAAGADLILGNHPHWVQGMEEIDGKPVFYALGNFVFDQMWEEQTMEGMIVELTYRGTTLQQVLLHPTLVIDQAQPNFLDPAGDGQRVLKRMKDASKGLLPY
jgi:poly-gamma-glutamate capsule biosynthesis protein CapA/YwtB (metallophosphatase superfamily)